MSEGTIFAGAICGLGMIFSIIGMVANHKQVVYKHTSKDTLKYHINLKVRQLNAIEDYDETLFNNLQLGEVRETLKDTLHYLEGTR